MYDEFMYEERKAASGMKAKNRLIGGLLADINRQQHIKKEPKGSFWRITGFG